MILGDRHCFSCGENWADKGPNKRVRRKSTPSFTKSAVVVLLPLLFTSLWLQCAPYLSRIWMVGAFSAPHRNCRKHDAPRSVISSISTKNRGASAAGTTRLYSSSTPNPSPFTPNQNMSVAKSAASKTIEQKRPNSSTNEQSTTSEAAADSPKLPDSALESALKQYGYDSRLLKISKSQLPIWAEVQDRGAAKICRIVDLVFAQDAGSAPKLKLKLAQEGEETDEKQQITRRIVDIGQITTIWQGSAPLLASKTPEPSSKTMMNANQINDILEQLYRSRVRRGRGTTNKGLTKKKINKLAATMANSPTEQDHAAQILRQIVKTGPKFARLIDSDGVLSEIQDNKRKKSITKHSHDHQSLIAQCLADSVLNGGRFKRFPCVWVGNDGDGDTDDDAKTVTIINGGWLVVDQNVRATTEGLQFAKKLSEKQDSDEKTAYSSKSGPTSASSLSTHTQFGADDRIAHRLECLAMGEEPSSKKDESKSLLEQDVRATLAAMDLPATPQGAREALLRRGRWTTASDNGGKVSLWSQDMLEAADWYAKMDQRRKQDLYRASHGVEIKDTGAFLEDRVDLTNLPCFCIDAARTSFRDDAIGIRPRPSTGRKVNTEASKWEILLHIADVSDIYVDDEIISGDKNANEYLAMLRNAAKTRGTSRYDLPGGPLHMMPPKVLESLSFQVFKPDWTNAESVAEQQKAHQSREQVANRCVTMWLYIDERSGKVMDAGFERTIVSNPTALSFQTATALLEGKPPGKSSVQDGEVDPMVHKMRAMLKVVERNIQKWKEYRQSISKQAQAREERMTAYEHMSRHAHGDDKGARNRRDDGNDGFRRTRGHLLVDAANDLYGYGLTTLVRKKGGSLPSIIGTKDARIGTGPLRRYIDGMAQREALSVLCDFGGRPLSKQECFEIGRQATDTLNRIATVKASKATAKSAIASTKVISRAKQKQAVRLLSLQMKAPKENEVSMPAMSTGKGSEVLLMDVGAVATCRGIQGTLKPGTRVSVRIESINPEKGSVTATLLKECNHIES